MNLKKVLRQGSYDLIDSPIRNHKPLQLWLKRPLNSVELYYENIEHALFSAENLSIVEDNSLNINFHKTQDYKFNIGITVLEELLTSLGLGNVGLSANFHSGRTVSVSYNNSKTLSVPNGEISNFISTSDFKHPNREFLRNTNRDSILIITGVLTATDLQASFVYDKEISALVETELAKAAIGKLEFQQVSDKEIIMKSEGNMPFPVAVKASKIDWDKGDFKKMTPITDTRSFF